jgi:hypothetical protein
MVILDTVSESIKKYENEENVCVCEREWGRVSEGEQ